MSEEKKETRRIPWLWIGLVFTVGIFGFGFYLAFQQNCYWQGPSPAGCMSNWKYFLNSPPNEMGDTLAGFAGALAFIWLVVAVMLQNQELRHALDEYEKMADAMQTQANMAREHLEDLKDERRLRQQAVAKDVFDERMRGVVRMCTNELGGWRVALADPQNAGGSTIAKIFPRFEERAGETLDEAMLAMHSYLIQFKDWAFEVVQLGILLEFSENKLWYHELQRRLQQLVDMYTSLGPDQLARFANLHIASSATILADICNNSEIWPKENGEVE